MTQIEPKTMRLWVLLGTVTLTWVGEENWYGSDEFGHEFFAKMDGG